MTKIWIIVIVTVVLILVTAGGTAALQMTTSNAFCSSCHAYEKTSWDHGVHHDVTCMNCHGKGFVRDKTQGARKMFLVFTGQVDPHTDPLPSYPDATMANCMDCHMSELIAERRPVYMERHAQYMAAAPYCIGCHEGGHVPDIRAMRDVAVRRGDL